MNDTWDIEIRLETQIDLDAHGLRLERLMREADSNRLDLKQDPGEAGEAYDVAYDRFMAYLAGKAKHLVGADSVITARRIR